MDRRTLVIVLAVVGGAFVLFFFSLIALVVAAGSGRGMRELGARGSNRIGVLEIKGAIRGSEGQVDDWLQDLKDFRDEDGIKAVVVRVNSPGGAVAPSQEIHDALVRTAKTKPVVVSMGNVAASGGYYVALGGSKIYAEPGTLTGSIGVIAQLPEVDGLMDWAHLKMHTVRSGKLKDLGSPFRPMTEEDQKFFQGLIDDVYGEFLATVAKDRKLPIEEVRPIADGRVLTGKQAKALKLIDELGGMEDAVEGAMELAHLKGKPTLVYPPEDYTFRFRGMMRQAASAVAEGMRSSVVPPGGVLFLMPGAELEP
jgi:protease-4